VKVFVAGATGVLGRPLVRMLVGRGDEVVGLTRVAGKRRLIEALGAQAAVADVLDADAIARELKAAAPTHVVHALTALPPQGPLRLGDLKATNLLRTKGTANLLAAAIGAGAGRLVAESFLGVYGPVSFDHAVTEDVRLPPPPPPPWREAVQALRSLEEQLAEARRAGRIETVVLRFGLFYGPEVPSTIGLARRLMRRQPVAPRGASGVGSFIHEGDAAAAVVAALDAPAPGAVYNIADDEPTALADYLRLTATALGTPPPRTVPSWLVRLLAPVPAAMASVRLPLSNAKAREELRWAPRFPTLRDGLRDVAAKLRPPYSVTA
jgi:nucleoside-diphosphate-sugar epimerase